MSELQFTLVAVFYLSIFDRISSCQSSTNARNTATLLLLLTIIINNVCVENFNTRENLRNTTQIYTCLTDLRVSICYCFNILME